MRWTHLLEHQVEEAEEIVAPVTHGHMISPLFRVASKARLYVGNIQLPVTGSKFDNGVAVFQEIVP